MTFKYIVSWTDDELEIDTFYEDGYAHESVYESEVIDYCLFDEYRFAEEYYFGKLNEGCREVFISKIIMGSAI